MPITPPDGGLVFFGAPSRRQRLARRRTVTIVTIAALALTGWVIGALSDPRPAQTAVTHYTYE